MKIVGHRGAAGLAPENTLKAIHAGIAVGADAVEFDVRRTKDGVFVLSHDSSLMRLAGIDKRVRNLTLTDIQKINFFDGEPIATLDDALKARGYATAVIEGKGKEWGAPLADYVQKYATANLKVISFNREELKIFHNHMPDIQCYVLERKYPFRAILTAHRMGIQGVDFNFWILNPFSYWFAKLYHLDIAVYTVNSPWLMRWFAWTYPRVAITTNYPNILKKIVR